MSDKNLYIPFIIGIILALLLVYISYLSIYSITSGQSYYNNRPPNLMLLSPQGGETLNGTVKIKWVASDPDGEPLMVTIQYTSDPPQYCPTCPPPQWHPIVVGISNIGEYDWDTTTIPDGSYVIRVLVSDGLNEVSVVSDWITINNTITT